MILNAQILDEEKLKRYQEKAVPLALKAGCQLLASGAPVVLDGDWPYQGELVVEKFSSMEAVKAYWYSDEYQQARKYLEGADIRAFTLVVEASD